jgi:ABC-type Mn2+/Zn2+ transport system permease subunit
MIMTIEYLFEPFQYSFMVRALIVCLLVGVMCPLLGSHVISREMSFMGDALAHAVVPGIVVAYSIGVSPFFGSIPMAIVVALSIGYVTKKSKISNDTSIGILFAGLFALGLILLSVQGGLNISVEDILLGQVISTSWLDVYVTSILAFLVTVIMIAMYKPMVFVGFDYQGAIVAGIKADKVDYLLLIVLSIVVVVTLNVVGIVLVIGMLITPAAAASLVVKRFSSTIPIGMLFGIMSAIIGLYISYYLDTPPGPSICLVSTAIFILAFVKTKIFTR